MHEGRPLKYVVYTSFVLCPLSSTFGIHNLSQLRSFKPLLHIKQGVKASHICVYRVH